MPLVDRPYLFVLGTGQDDNVGDAALRREYFNRLRDLGQLNIYVGPASQDFLEALGLLKSDVVYSDFGAWQRSAWRQIFRHPVWIVDNAGELQLAKWSIRLQLAILPLVLLTLLRRGQVIRVGLAARSIHSPYWPIMRPLLRLSTLVIWRDTATPKSLGFGSIGPDWAFAWRGNAVQYRAGERDLIAVSYRGDKPPLSDTGLQQLRSTAERTGKRLVVVSQVRRDVRRSAELASVLDAELVPWPEDRSLTDHETVLRAIYRKSALVVSDRLHALIIGMTEGAVPACVTDAGEAKIERHFEAIGFERTTFSLNESQGSVVQALAEQIGRYDEASRANNDALKNLDSLTARMAKMASSCGLQQRNES